MTERDLISDSIDFISGSVCIKTFGQPLQSNVEKKKHYFTQQQMSGNE